MMIDDRTSLKRYALLLLSIIFSSIIAFPAHAGLIRDAEIEATLRSYADPILKTADLKPSAISLYIVQDDSLNAFVAGGSNLFIHTGLITATPTPDMLIGVIAHETGHIAGGHLAKGSEKLKNAQLGTIMATVLGAAAAVATGKPEAAAAVISGTSNSVARNFFSFSRANENAADQAALGFLDKVGGSADGMVKMFELLKQQERQKFGTPDPYLRTHPLTNERIDHVRSHAENTKAVDNYSSQFNERHARMVAKLAGFLQPPEKVLRNYPANDNSVAARMARAVAYFRMAQMEQADSLMQSLLNEHPDDPYLHDLYGQILFESGRTDQALLQYRKASALLPNNALILSDLGKSELVNPTPDTIRSAITHLERATTIDSKNSATWRLLATAYGKANNAAMASLAMAEESLLIGDVDRAIQQSTAAIDSLKPGSPTRQRANDIKTLAIKMREEKKEAQSLF